MPQSPSFRSILVPVDGSALAEQAIPYAITIARRAGSKVRLALVREQFPPVAIGQAAETYTRALLQLQRSENAYLRMVTSRVREKLGSSLSSVALEGPVVATLAEYARDTRVDLVIMTTHGRSGLERAWLGSVADQLIRTLEVPVLALPGFPKVEPSGIEAIPEITVPLDGSPLGEAVLEPVARMARLWRARVSLVRIVHAVLIGTDPALPLSTSYDEELTNLERDAAQTYLDKVSEWLRGQGVETRVTVILGGAVAKTLLEFARWESAGMIALATHGRGGLARVALGSVADKLIRAAETPVLVVRPRAQHRGTSSSSLG